MKNKIAAFILFWIFLPTVLNGITPKIVPIFGGNDWKVIMENSSEYDIYGNNNSIVIIKASDKSLYRYLEVTNLYNAFLKQSKYLICVKNNGAIQIFNIIEGSLITEWVPRGRNWQSISYKETERSLHVAMELNHEGVNYDSAVITFGNDLSLTRGSYSPFSPISREYTRLPSLGEQQSQVIHSLNKKQSVRIPSHLYLNGPTAFRINADLYYLKEGRLQPLNKTYRPLDFSTPVKNLNYLNELQKEIDSIGYSSFNILKSTETYTVYWATGAWYFGDEGGAIIFYNHSEDSLTILDHFGYNSYPEVLTNKLFNQALVINDYALFCTYSGYSGGTYAINLDQNADYPEESFTMEGGFQSINYDEKMILTRVYNKGYKIYSFSDNMFVQVAAISENPVLAASDPIGLDQDFIYLQSPFALHIASIKNNRNEASLYLNNELETFLFTEKGYSSADGSTDSWIYYQVGKTLFPESILSPYFNNPDFTRQQFTNPAPIPTNPYLNNFGTVTVPVLNMRDGYSLNDKVFSRVTINEGVFILETTDHQDTIDNITAPWYKVLTSDGRQGWIFGGYVKTYD